MFLSDAITVEELIKKLQKLNPKEKVIFYDLYNHVPLTTHLYAFTNVHEIGKKCIY